MAQTIERICKTCSAPITGQGRRSYCQDSCNPRNQRLRCPGCDEPVFGHGQRYCSRAECRPRCSEVGCDEVMSAKGSCVIHYHRSFYWERLRAPRPCATCGADLPIRRGGQLWCSTGCRPRCIEDGCDRPQRTASRCGKHYRIGGTRSCLTCGCAVDEKRQYCSPSCYPRCLVEWCDGRGKTHGLCDRHYSQMRVKGVVVDTFRCGMCSSPIPTFRPDGSVTKASTKLCDPCRQSYRPGSKTSVNTLVLRDGRNCSLCFEDIDLELAWPDPKSASIDHVFPRSLGGTDDPSNLALSHLGCNCSKGNNYTP